MKKVLVTGGGGFWGRNLVCGLRKIADLDIITLDATRIDYQDEGVKHLVGDFSEESLLETVLPDVETVIHVDSTANPANDDYVSDVSRNLLGSVRLIRACEVLGVKRFLYASSGGTVYGPTDIVPTDEDQPRNPICSYGIVKMAVENYLAMAAKRSGMIGLSLRESNIYGPWQNWNERQGAAAVFCHAILSGEEIRLYGGGLVKRDFLYVDDLVDAYVAALNYEGDYASVNIGSGSSVSLRELVKCIEQFTGLKAKVKFLPSRGCDVPVSQLNIERARRLLSWRPKTQLEDGIANLVAWQRENPTVFSK